MNFYVHHYSISVNSFSKEIWCRIWDNVDRYGTTRQPTGDSITRRMRCACRISKTRIQPKCVALNAFARQKMVSQTHLDVTLYENWPSWILFRWISGFTGTVLSVNPQRRNNIRLNITNTLVDNLTSNWTEQLISTCSKSAVSLAV